MDTPKIEVKYTIRDSWNRLNRDATPTGRWKIVLRQNIPYLYIEFLVSTKIHKMRNIPTNAKWWSLAKRTKVIEEDIIKEDYIFVHENEIAFQIEYPIQSCKEIK